MVRKEFYVIDTHTEGEPTRILFWSWPMIEANNITELREILRQRYDWIRRSVLYEPRGHKDQFGAIVFPKLRKDVDYSLIFMDTEGYLDMCGHATMGVTKALIELGYVEPKEPYTVVRYETPAGVVEAKAHIENGSVKSISVVDVPSFYVGTYEVPIEFPTVRKVSVDIAFGGNFYAIVNSKDIGMHVEPTYINDLIKAGLHIREQANKFIKVTHPEKPFINRIVATLISEEKSRTSARSTLIFAKGSVDRSPSGTGTAARVAMLFGKGLIKINEEYTHESIIGTVFKCRLIKETTVGSYKAVVPEITGRAWITQISKIVINEDDPLKYGFLLT